VDDEAELDRINEALVESVNRSGVAFVSHTKVGGRYAIRIAIGNAASQWEHVERAWATLRDASNP
jgi:aromatic-L-amino-acid decarboxylase